ncbi:AraC family transcriptional regulator [Stratiformator vulcanicus]|nr:AraC family transcriptional regulator [Stratiformator vulcanicus]
MVKPTFEKLIPTIGSSFRCFDRTGLNLPSRWHRHPEIELTYVDRGTGTRLVGDNIDSYRDHDLVLIGSDLPHTWQSDQYLGRKYDRHSAIVIQFHPDFLGEQFFELPEFEAISMMLTSARRGLWFPAEVGEQIGAVMTRMTIEPPVLRLIHLLEVLSELSSCPSAEPLSSQGFAPSLTSASETRTEKVCHYISQHFRNPNLSHEELASHACMNPSAFSRFFKQSTGKTLTEYLNELRIGLACRLLMDSDMSILDVSLEAGFANVSYFNRRFRESRGMTPREYRRRYTEATETSNT